ncbi:ABC transporter ATP-binding protein [Humibacter sp. RRB41]|uniref:ABC transporter ATP-binding protein n=1 Tax=Humibacter sp. RRB41 TaxID=2919946 RepID=UPI001FA99BA2|nr:ABC transporter ATP-binding protein [Humibacter sp. RRB41]
MGLGQTIRRTSLAQLLRGTSKRTLAAIAALSVVGGASEALLLIFIVQVGTLSLGGAQSSVVSRVPFMPSSLGATIVAGIVAGVLTIVMQVGAVWLILRETNRRSIGLRRLLLHRFLFTSVSGQSNIPPGEMQELASQGIARSADGFIFAGNVAANAVNLAMLVVAAFFVSPIAAMSLIGMGALLALLFLPLSRMNLRSNNAWVHANASLAGFVSIVSRLGTEAKVFGVREKVEEAADERIHEIAGSWMRSRMIWRGSPIVFRVSILLLALAVLGVVLLVSPSAVSAVAVIALLLVRSLSYVQNIQSDSQNLHELAVHAVSVTSRIASFPPDDVVWGRDRLGGIHDIELRGVTYGYGEHDQQLKPSDFRASRGELITITGASGEGKSTFLKVLLRLVEPRSGDYLVNDIEVETVRDRDWYERIAYLPQEVRLIPGTVADNVRFYRDASEAEIHSAIGMASLLLEPVRFPDGLMTEIHEDGRNLSGGQRQRIGLARALLKKPDLLVLDEPTSALDPKTEQEVVETIRLLKPHMIAVLVTHQPTVAREADRTYAMRGGLLLPAEVRQPS